MRDDDVLACGAGELTGVFLIQLVQHARVLLVVLLVSVLPIRVGLDERVADVRHLHLRIGGRKPHVRVVLPMVVVGFVAAFMLSFVLVTCRGEQVDALRGLDRDEVFVADSTRDVVHPMLHPGTAVHEHLGGRDGLHVGGGRLPVVRLGPGRHKAGHVHAVAADFLGEVVHGVEGCDDGDLVSGFGTGALSSAIGRTARKDCKGCDRRKRRQSEREVFLTHMRFLQGRVCGAGVYAGAIEC